MLPFLEIGIVSIVIGIIGLSIARIFQWSKEQASDERTDNPQNWVLLELFPQSGFNPRFTEIFLDQWLKIGIQSLDQKDAASLSITFEVHSDGGQLHLFLKVHKEYAQLCRQMLGEAFPGMGVQEAVDPLLNWDTDIRKTVTKNLNHNSLFEVGLSKHSIFPVASYKDLGQDTNLILDPFQVLLLALRDLTQDQYVIAQYCLSPATKQIDDWQSEYEHLHTQFLSRSDKDEESHSKFLTKHEKDLLVGAKNKLSSDVFKTCLRCGVFASDPQKVRDTLSTIKLYLQEYNTQLQTLIARTPQSIPTTVLEEESTSLVSMGLTKLIKRFSKKDIDVWNQRFYTALLSRQIDSVDNRSNMMFSAEDATSLWHIPTQLIPVKVQQAQQRQLPVATPQYTQPEPVEQPVVVAQEELKTEIEVPAFEETQDEVSRLQRLRDYPEEFISKQPEPVFNDYSDQFTPAQDEQPEDEKEHFETPLSQAIHEMIKKKGKY